MNKSRWDFVGILSLLWFPVACSILTLSVILWGPVIVLSGALGLPDRYMKYLVRSWASPIPYYFLLRHKIHYPPNFEQEYSVDKPVVIISNHQSLLDIPAAYLALNGNIRMLAKDSLFRIPIFGAALKFAGHVKIVRGDRGSGRAAIEALRVRLSRGLQIWIAPEGTRSLSWKMSPFKPGGFSVALDLELPIQPMVVLNAFQILGRKNLIPRIGSCLEAQVLPLIEPNKLGLSDRVLLSQYSWEQMHKALESYWKAREI